MERAQKAKEQKSEAEDSTTKLGDLKRRVLGTKYGRRNEKRERKKNIFHCTDSGDPNNYSPFN